MALASELCAICQTQLDPSGATVLPCAHKFHPDCTDAYAENEGKHFADMPCPECRIIPSEALSRELEPLDVAVAAQLAAADEAAADEKSADEDQQSLQTIHLRIY